MTNVFNIVRIIVLYKHKEIMNQIVKIRICTYKSFRHYGGREINTTSNTCDALFIRKQGDNTNLVELVNDCAGFKKGHKIAIQDIDFNIN